MVSSLNRPNPADDSYRVTSGGGSVQGSPILPLPDIAHALAASQKKRAMERDAPDGVAADVTIPETPKFIGRASAMRFIVLLGVLSLFADMTYESARSITGPYLGILGASCSRMSIRKESVE